MTRYVKATFSDGSIAKRSSMGKHYTHACGNGRYASFATSLERAVKAANGREVVPVEEITAKEYRAKDFDAAADKRVADRIDGYDRDDLGESPDY